MCLTELLSHLLEYAYPNDFKVRLRTLTDFAKD